MDFVRSADGTRIEFERIGEGPPLIFVNGALSERRSGAALAELLAPHRSVVMYDRRGRGESGDTSPYAVDREIDDLVALIDHLVEPTAVFAHSSGGTLTLWSAMRGVPFSRVVVYEPPFLVDDQRPRPPADLGARLASLIAAGDRPGALRAFLVDGVGVPPEGVDAMAGTPMWSEMLTLAHTTPYDAAITGGIELPRGELGALTVPVLVLQGGASPAWMRAGTEALAAAMPEGELGIIEGHTHGGPQTAPDLVAAEILAFLG